MSYKRLNIKNGDIINDYHINYLQDAISKISSESRDFKERLALILTNKGILASKEDSFEELLFKITNLPDYIQQQREPKWPDIREGIQSGHIRLLMKTGGPCRFYLASSSPSKAVINWGDGTVSKYFLNTGLWIQRDISVSAGTTLEEGYNVTTVDISLDTEDSSIIQFITDYNNVNSRNNLLWFCSKDIIFTNGYCMFNGNINYGDYPCTKLKYIDFIGGGIVGNLDCFARGCSSLERVTGNFKPSGYTTRYAFSNCSKLSQFPPINLEGVTSSEYMYNNCKALTGFDYYINNNGTLTNTARMFYGCINLKKFVDEQIFDLSVSTAQDYFFADCNNLIASPRIIFGSGTAAAFYHNCRSLISVQDTIDANNISSINSFFRGCISLVDGPSEFFANNTTNSNYLFYDCNSIKAVPRSLSFAKATSAQYMFSNCFNLQVAPSIINLPLATDIREMFQGCGTLKTPPSTINADSAVNAFNLFYNCSMLVSAPNSMRFPVATNIAVMFYNCSSLINGPDTIYAPVATNASQFFKSCNMLQNAGRNFEIGNNVTNCSFSEFFSLCSSLTTLPTEGDMHQGSNYNNCFWGVTEITYESFTNFCGKGLSFPNATSLASMFQSSGVKRVPNISAPMCTGMGEFFRGNRLLQELGDLNCPKCTNFSNMFYDGCPSLTRIGTITIDSLTNNNAYFSNMNMIESLTIKNLRVNFSLNNAKSLTSVRLETPNTTYMGNLDFYNCNLSAEALNLLLQDLPDRTGKQKYTINIKGNPGSGSCDKTIGERKNWTVTTA